MKLLKRLIRNEFDSKGADHIGCLYLAQKNGFNELFQEMLDDMVFEKHGTVDGIIKKVREYENKENRR